MNDKIVLDFGKITSEMEEKAVKLLFVKDKSWFVIDDNNNLFSIENYWHNSYLDKLIGEGCVVTFEKSDADLSKISGFDQEIWNIDKVQQFIENVVKIEYPNVKEAISVKWDHPPACRFNLGDKVKIPYICDGDRHNGEVGEVTWIHPYKFYPGGDINNHVWKYQMGISYPDGQSITVDPDRKPSCIVSEVILVEPKSAHFSLGTQIQSASARAAESHPISAAKPKVPESER